MAVRGVDADEEQAAAGVPDDVAILYAWANLHGAKYRDFSASRREYRTQIRYRAAQTLLERELERENAAQASAIAAERAALAAEQAARSRTFDSNYVSRIHPPHEPEVAVGELAAPYESLSTPQAFDPSAKEEARFALDDSDPESYSGPPQFLRAGRYDPPLDTANNSSTSVTLSLPPAPEREASWSDNSLGLWKARRQTVMADAWEGSQGISFNQGNSAAPAWLFAPQAPSAVRLAAAVAAKPAKETLLDSRERVAARWSALKGVFEEAGPELPAMQPVREGERRLPLLLVFSLAGGVGKTSLVATLGRALSSLGEKLLLTDTTSQGLLPYYFGTRELGAGVPRSFSPPKGSQDLPVSLISYALEQVGEDERRRALMAEEIVRNGEGNSRVLVDLSSASGWLIRSIARLHPTVLVPLTPEMNSVIGIQAIERFFEGIVDADGRAVLPVYLLNQFDATLPLHLDVREVFRRQLGDRLLRFVVRRSPAVSEALAEGMTVMDYAAEAPVTKDYLDIAEWLRTVSPPATGEFRQVRWSER